MAKPSNKCYIYVIFLILLSIDFQLFAQKELKVSHNLGDGIIFKDKTDLLESRMFLWGHSTTQVELPVSDKTNLQQLDFSSSINRLRLGSQGWILNNKFRYLFQVAFGEGETNFVTNAPTNGYNGLLDAAMEYDVTPNFTISVGQRFLPSHREAFMGARNLQFFNRSLLFNFAGFDRDAGIFAWYKINIGNILFKPTVSVTQGEGRNFGSFGLGGLNYNFRGDIYILGGIKEADEAQQQAFNSTKPSLVLGFGYGFNDNAVRSGGLSGNFNSVERDIESYFVDLLFKYKGFSLTAEAFEKNVTIPVIYNSDFEILGVFESGYGFNVQAGYFLNQQWEIASRYTKILPTPVTGLNTLENISLVANRYFAGNGIKLQTELGYLKTQGNQNPQLSATFLVALGI